MDKHSGLNYLFKKSSLFLSEDTCLTRSDKLHFWRTCFFQSGSKESTWPAWLCTLCHSHHCHIPWCFLQWLCALLLSRKGVNVCGNWAQTRMQYCKLGFFAWKQWCQTGFSPWRAVFLLQWNSSEPFNWATKLVTGTREKSFSSFPLPFSPMLNLLVQRAVQDLILFYPFSCPSTQLRQTQLDVIF